MVELEGVHASLLIRLDSNDDEQPSFGTSVAAARHLTPQQQSGLHKQLIA